MAAIKVKNTKPEMLVCEFLFANGYRYKLHDKSLPGKPVRRNKENCVTQISNFHIVP
jgi:G:T-mismatch repair DNA endonuclease (very short patch repair protein)